jgi:hypothetical protein
VGLQEGLWREVGLKPSVVHWLYVAVLHFCVSGMVVWLSDGLRQEETKQGPNISLLMDNRSYAHHSH